MISPHSRTGTFLEMAFALASYALPEPQGHCLRSASHTGTEPFCLFGFCEEPKPAEHTIANEDTGLSREPRHIFHPANIVLSR